MLLILHIYFIDQTYFQIKGYEVVSCNHPYNRIHGGSAFWFKSPLNYIILDDYSKSYLQDARIQIKYDNCDLSIYSIYFPPRHNNMKRNNYDDCSLELGTEFIVGVDFNGKHRGWISRLENRKFKELKKCP